MRLEHVVLQLCAPSELHHPRNESQKAKCSNASGKLAAAKPFDWPEGQQPLQTGSFCLHPLICVMNWRLTAFMESS